MERTETVKLPTNGEVDRILLIKQTVCEVWGRVTVEELDGPLKSRRISDPRRAAMGLCYDFRAGEPDEISSSFGGRGRTTAVHARSKILKKRGLSEEFERRYLVCKKTLEQKLAPPMEDYSI